MGIKDAFDAQAQRNAAAKQRKAEAAEAASRVIVKTYDKPKDYEKDAPKMAAQGYLPQGQTDADGKVSVGGTALKLGLTMGLGAITGLSHKKGNIVVTWIKQ